MVKIKPAEPTAPPNETAPDYSTAIGMANLYATTAQALTLAMHNATALQQQTNITAQTATANAVALLFATISSKPPTA